MWLEELVNMGSMSNSYEIVIFKGALPPGPVVV